MIGKKCITLKKVVINKMNSFNRNNPFLYSLDAVSKKLFSLIQASIKDWIIQGCIGVVTIITSFIYWGLYKIPQYIPIIICIGLWIFSLLEIQRVVRNFDIAEINNIKYGNVNNQSMMGYSYINNEELFAKVNQLTTQCGKIEFLRESIYIFYFIELFIFIINILHILIYVFK